MRSALRLGASVLLGAMLFSVPCMAADFAVVEVSFDIPTFLYVDIVSPTITINPVQVSELEQGTSLPHTGSSLIDVRSNVECSLRTPIEDVLVHTSGSPSVPVEATIQLIGANAAQAIMIGGVWHWVLDFLPGVHDGTTSLVVRVQQVWTALSAGVYTGTIYMDVVEAL